jgi:hypothetical protein
MLWIFRSADSLRAACNESLQQQNAVAIEAACMGNSSAARARPLTARKNLLVQALQSEFLLVALMPINLLVWRKLMLKKTVWKKYGWNQQ